MAKRYLNKQPRTIASNAEFENESSNCSVNTDITMSVFLGKAQLAKFVLLTENPRPKGTRNSNSDIRMFSK